MTLHTAWPPLGRLCRRLRAGSAQPQQQLLVFGGVSAAFRAALHMARGFHFFNWLSGNARKGRGCQENLQPLEKEYFGVSCSSTPVFAARPLGKICASCAVPGAKLISHKSNEVPGCSGEGSGRFGCRPAALRCGRSPARCLLPSSQPWL